MTESNPKRISGPSGPWDRIRIQSLMARTVVGLAEWERDKKQDVSISLVLHLDLRPAGRSDRVEDTVDYKAIKNRILQRVESTSFALIERMAEVIAQICLDDPKVQRVDVTVDKLSALRFARSVAVEISRSRAEIEPP